MSTIPVPIDYTCKICNIPGHWIEHCPIVWRNSLYKPPTIPNYNWIKDFPNQFNSDSHNLNTNNNQNNLSKSLPLSYYISNQQCPNIITSTLTPPTDYVCYRYGQPDNCVQNCPKCEECGIFGHNYEECPARNIGIVVKLNDEEIMQIAKAYDMTWNDTEKWINICKTEQWNRFAKIDNALDKYYKSFKIYDYKDENGIGKFLQFCLSNNLKPDELESKLVGPFVTYKNCIYVGWDSNFPFDPFVTISAEDRKQVMYQVIKHYYKHKGYPSEFLNRTNMDKIRKIIGLEKHKTYHILSDEYCCNHYGEDLNCKYCDNPHLYHIYLVTGYADDFAPKGIVELILSYFESLD